MNINRIENILNIYKILDKIGYYYMQFGKHKICSVIFCAHILVCHSWRGTNIMVLTNKTIRQNTVKSQFGTFKTIFLFYTIMTCTEYVFLHSS